VQVAKFLPYPLFDPREDVFRHFRADPEPSAVFSELCAISFAHHPWSWLPVPVFSERHPALSRIYQIRSLSRPGLSTLRRSVSEWRGCGSPSANCLKKQQRWKDPQQQHDIPFARAEPNQYGELFQHKVPRTAKT